MPATVIPTKTNPVFNSKVENLLLYRVHDITEYLGAGNIRQERCPSLYYQFDQGILVVDDELRERDRQYFERNRDAYQGVLDEAPAEEWLRSHEKFDTTEGVGGFWEIYPQAPDSSPDLAQITDLTLDGDIEALLLMWEAENGPDGWQRADVNETLTKAIERLSGRADGEAQEG